MAFRVEFLDSEKLDREVDDFVVELEGVFGVKWKWSRPNVFLIDDRRTIDLIKKEKTEDWLVGWSCGKDVFLLSGDSFERESCHKFSEEEYLMLLRHEVVHCFCNVFFPWFMSPLWLREGLAIYFSGQVEMKKKVEKFERFLGCVDSGGEGLYEESGFAVGVLVREFGVEKLAELLRGVRDVKTSEEFEVLFEGVYGFELGYRWFNERGEA